MRILTNEEMHEADRYTIETLGVPALELMECAGKAVVGIVESLYLRGKIACVCGGGNNGGDGYVCARLLKEKGYDVCVVSIAEKFSEECAVNRAKFLAIGGEICNALPRCGLIIDCLFGTGFHGAPSAECTALIDAINAEDTVVVTVDVPSGVNGNSGEVANKAVRADVCVSIGETKAGAYLTDGIDYAGEIVRMDIGIALPRARYAERTESAYVRGLLPRRKRNSHKGDYGKCAIVAGSERYTGACYLSTLGCLRAGAGYTALFAPKTVVESMYFQCPEALLVPVCDGGVYAFNEEKMRNVLDYDAVVYGMGMGVSEEVANGIKYLLQTYTGKLVIDADGLNSLSVYDGLALLKTARCEVLMTPHLKEFSRLTGQTVQALKADGLDAPRAFAKDYGVSVLLKNAVSVITDGWRTFVNTTGTAGQAKAGSGDVLAGVVGALCAVGLSAFDAGVAGAFLVGRSAEIAVETHGEYSLLATDVCAGLSQAFLRLFAEESNEDCDDE